MALVFAAVPFVVTVAPAAASDIEIGTNAGLPSSAIVGQTNEPGFMAMTNDSFGAGATSNLTVNSITAVPACGTEIPVGNGDCPAAEADPGVFVVNSPATGQTGTGCAGASFTVTIIDAVTGQVQFTPTGSPVVLTPFGTAGDSCIIDFSVNVDAEPIHPAAGSGNGLVTDAIGFVTATSQANGESGGGSGTAPSTINKAQPGLTTIATAGSRVAGPISDTATLTPALPPGPEPTGTITFTAYGPSDRTCASTPAFVSSPVGVNGTGAYPSPVFSPTVVGSYVWVAAYSGDANNAAVTAACGSVGETTTVSPATPTISTTPSAPVTVGGAISDTAALSGGVAPTGTIVFDVFGPGNATCTGSPTFTSSTTVHGNGTYTSSRFTTTTAGTYLFVAAYSGDTDNGPATNACGAESVIVTAAVGRFTTVTPARDLDTRTGTGGTTGPVHGNTTFKVAVTGVNGVPATGVGAVALNVTVTSPTCAAWLTVFPAGQSVPASSNLNYTAGEAIANLVVVGVGTGGQVSFNVPAACAGSVQVIADVQGWYATQAGTPLPGSYTPLAPARDLDTRGGAGGTTGPVHGNTTFNVTVAGVNGVRATGVGAVVLNVTVTSPTCAAWLTVFPAGQSVPASSNLNYTAGETIANLVVVGVGTGGQVSFNVPAACAGSVQVIADIQGWYATQAAVPLLGSYTPVTPGRDLDTRSGVGGTKGAVHGNSTFSVTVAGVNGVPASGVGAVALNVAATDPTCTAWLTVFPAGQAVPASSNLNYTAGETIPNLVIVGVGTSGQVSFNVPSACTGSVQLVADIQGWYAQ